MVAKGDTYEIKKNSCYFMYSFNALSTLPIDSLAATEPNFNSKDDLLISKLAPLFNGYEEDYEIVNYDNLDITDSFLSRNYNLFIAEQYDDIIDDFYTNVQYMIREICSNTISAFSSYEYYENDYDFTKYLQGEHTFTTMSCTIRTEYVAEGGMIISAEDPYIVGVITYSDTFSLTNGVPRTDSITPETPVIYNNDTLVRFEIAFITSIYDGMDASDLLETYPAYSAVFSRGL